MAGSPPRRLKRKVVLAGLGVLVTLAVVVSATQVNYGDQMVAICHATSSAENPYVFLTARRDGFEHGHHRHHEDDFFPEDPSRGCDGDEVPVAPVNGTEPAPGNETDDGNDDDAGNATDDASDDAAGNETDDGSNDDAGNETDDGSNDAAGNDTDDGNVTGNETPEPVPAGDAAVRQSSVQDDFEVVLTITVSSLGPGVAQDVNLDDTLPDVRRTWNLGGDDAASCVLEGRSLACWFGDLAPGEDRVVELRAYTDRMPCGFALTNTALVSSVDDLESRNDASSAGIAARAC